ncbi:MAG: hypothetical protein IPM51_14445 [Sphingobacteriaceae bacterium]|nr:hypothetical protein [Sphingobacteriaceae bacterium]
MIIKLIPNIIFVLCLFLYNQSLSQTKEFTITIPESRDFTSQYKSIDLLDLRYDTLDNGFILSNRKKTNIVLSLSFRNQLNKALYASDTANAKHKLLLVLRKFKLVEKNDIDFEYGFCFMRAIIFANINEKYYRLQDFDTLITLNGTDVTDTLFHDASTNFVRLIEAGIEINPVDKIAYAYSDIVRIENDEKRIIPVYSTDKFTDGVYLSFHSFKNQKPDYAIEKIQYKWNTNPRIKVKNKEGRLITLTGNDVFGFVDKGVPYACTDHGSCIIERKNNELFYAAKSKVTNDNAEYEISVAVAEKLGSATEKALSAVKPPYGIFVSRIDYIDGSFMRVKKIK